MEGESCEVNVTCKTGHQPSETDTFILSVCKALTPHPLESGDWQKFKVATDTIKVVVKVESADEKSRRLQVEASPKAVSKSEKGATARKKTAPATNWAKKKMETTRQVIKPTQIVDMHKAEATRQVTKPTQMVDMHNVIDVTALPKSNGAKAIVVSL